MSREISIRYQAHNRYENWVNEAYWQFLIIPQQNSTQEFVEVNFQNSVNAQVQYSINGYGFQTIRIHPKQKFKSISFDAHFELIKKEVNPFDFQLEEGNAASFRRLNQLDFKVDFEPFLRKTYFTTLPEKSTDLFRFDSSQSIFENLIALNQWTYRYINFKTNVTDVNTSLQEIIKFCRSVLYCPDRFHHVLA